MLIYEQKSPEPQFHARGVMDCGMAVKPFGRKYLMRERPGRDRFLYGTLKLRS